MTDVMTERDTRWLDFLIAADFEPVNGYSYPELLEFLRQYKRFYSLLYDDKLSLMRQANLFDKEVLRLETRIAELEKTVERKGSQVENLSTFLTKKLTWKERLTGKINLKP